MTLQDTALRDSGVSPTLSRYLDYRRTEIARGSEAAPDHSDSTNLDSTNPRNLLVYAEKANTEQSELARRLYHELMLYELEARRPHNERRVRARNEAQIAAEQAHQGFLDAAADLELEKYKKELAGHPVRQKLSREEREKKSREK